VASAPVASSLVAFAFTAALALEFDPPTSRSTSNTARGCDFGTSSKMRYSSADASSNIESSNISVVSGKTSSLYAPTCISVLIAMTPLRSLI
jgi:hypothetical protein